MGNFGQLPFAAPTGGPGGMDLLFEQSTYFADDFVSGGYSRDLALASESDPGSHFSEVVDAGVWHVTNIDGAADEGETISILDERGGVVAIVTNDADNDATQAQVNGECFGLDNDKDVYFACRMKVDDVSTGDWFVGLGVTDTTFLGAPADYIGFGDSDSAGNILAVNGKNASGGEVADATAQTNETQTDVGNLSDDTYVKLSFRSRGLEQIEFYVDDVLLATHTTNLPDDALLTPTLAIRNSSAAVSTLSVDYIVAVQER